MGELNGTNIAVVVCRLSNGPWQHVFVAVNAVDDSFVSNQSKERGFVFPLRFQGSENSPLTSVAFWTNATITTIARKKSWASIYVALNAPTYRTRYAGFLRTEFPRIPLPENAVNFEAVCALGSALVEAHLLREFPRRGLAQYHGRGASGESVRYSREDQRVAINKTQSFAPVPQGVWEFHVGGYQVLDKYLKSRKGRVLSLDEINHVGAVADSLAFTIEQMARIDEAYQAAFPDRG